MPKDANPSLPPLERALLQALKSVDNQIAREMQRTPAQRDVHGVQKWDPYQKRVERLCSFILSALGAEEVALDGILVLAQALSKSLHLFVEDLAPADLGKLRSAYCAAAAQSIAQDMRRVLDDLETEGALT